MSLLLLHLYHDLVLFIKLIKKIEKKIGKTLDRQGFTGKRPQNRKSIFTKSGSISFWGYIFKTGCSTHPTCVDCY